MQANTFQVGDRVQLIPFKHKGKVATVKYFGAIGRKFGTWVGLELDEPTGEISGDVNGEQLFECRPMHGLLLRNTQVKIYSEESVPVRPRTSTIPNNILLDGGEDEGKGGGYSDSPLITPRHTEEDSEPLSHGKPSKSSTSASTLMQAMTQAIQNPTAIRSQTTANTEEDTKKRGWQERLEKLKEKKQQEKDKARQKTDFEAKASMLSEEDRVREAFAPASGIQRTLGGGFKVSQEEVKKGPSGEEILQKAIKDTENEEIGTTRSSLASINKMIKSGVSPAKPTGSFITTASTVVSGTAAASGSKTTRSVQSAKQQELAAKKEEIAAKKEEIERARKERETKTKAPVTGTGTGVTGVKPVGQAQKIGAASATTKEVTAKDAALSKDPLTARTQPKTTAVGKIAAVDSKLTIGKIAAGATKLEEEKKTAAAATRRPAMTQPTSQLGMKRSDSRTAVSTRQTIGAGAGSPRRSRMEETEAANKSTTALGAKVPALTTKPVRATRDRTPGPDIPVPKVNPIEMKKMENSIKDMETENHRLQSQIKTLESEKNSWTKERAEKEALASKAVKEKNEVLAKVEKEKKEIEDKANREKETIKKTYETKIASLQTQVKSQQEENQQLQASQDDMASLERSKIEEDQAMKVVQLEGMLEEQNIKMKAQEQQISESQQLVLEAEAKLTEMQIKMAETEQKLKDQAVKISETEAQHADREQIHTARISDMETQLQKYQEEMAAQAVAVTDQNKEYFIRKEEEIAARFHQTQLAFEKSLIEASDAAKKAQEAEKAALAKLEEEIARRIDENEIHELEMQTLVEEKRDLMDRLMEQGKVEEVDPLKDLGLEEIKLQNKKLRQAITALTFGFEEEKRKLENQMKNETGKDKIIASMEKRLEEMDFLLEEVERKEKERAEMEEKLEEIVEYENMVEEMVQEIANREEENEDCMERIKELEEENQLLEELNQGLELDNTEMQEDLAKKEKELIAAKNEIEQLEGIVIDQDGLTSKYKERQQEFQKQIKVLSEQLSESVNAGNKDQVSILLEKQQQLIARLRDAEKKSLQITKSQITMQQERMGIEVVQNMLPESLMNEALLPCLKKMQELNFIKHKAMMLLREICETQVDNAANVYADLSHMQKFFGVLLSLSMLSNRLVQSGHRIFFFISNMTPGQYAEITRLLAWEQLQGVTQEIDLFLLLLKEENLTYNQDLTAFENQVRQVEQLQVTVEKTFGTFSPEELKARDELGPSAPEPVTLTMRKALLKKCPKLSLREQVLTMAVGVIFVPRLSTLYASELERRQVIQKVCLIYWRLLDILLKLDNVTNTASGDEFIDEEANSTDVRLQQKYVSIKALWEGSADEKHEASQKSWSSVLESIERDVTSLNNDFRFKQLADRVEAKYGTGKIDFNDLYSIDYKAGGPWRVISEQVKSELQDMGALKQRNTHLLEKQKDQLKQMAHMKKEKDEAVFITQTLKGQLSQAVAKADQVPALEIERNDLQEQIKSVKKQLEAANKDITISRASVEDFKTKLEEAKKQQATATQQAENEMILIGSSNQGGIQRGNAIRARTGATKHRSRESGAAYFFKNMHAAGMRMDSQQNDVRASHTKNQQSIANSAQILQQMQMSEDIYTETINQLQADRMRLRGKDMLERLTKLQEAEGAFSVVTKQLREAEKKREATNKGVAVKLNKAEQIKLHSALESVETLKFKVKKQMACRRIVDLTKGSVASKPEESKVDAIKQPNFTETFNYMVMETREKINGAMQVLFTKDSKLRKLHADQQPPPSATSNTHQDPVQVQSFTAKSFALNQVQIGSLRLRSQIKIPQNRVLLDESALAELRRNVALFAAN